MLAERRGEQRQKYLPTFNIVGCYFIEISVEVQHTHREVPCMHTTQHITTKSTHLCNQSVERQVGCQRPRRPFPTRATPAHPPCAERDGGCSHWQPKRTGQKRPAAVSSAWGPQRRRQGTLRPGPGEHPGGRGQRRGRAQVAAPALSRALRKGWVGHAGCLSLGWRVSIGGLGPCRNLKKGSLQLSLAAWSWGRVRASAGLIKES